MMSFETWKRLEERVRSRWIRWSRNREGRYETERRGEEDEEEEDDDDEMQALLENFKKKLERSCSKKGDIRDVPFHARCIALLERLLIGTTTVASECSTAVDMDCTMRRDVLLPWTSSQSADILVRLSVVWRFVVVMGTLPAMPLGSCPSVGYRCFWCKKEQNCDECHHLVSTIVGAEGEKEEVEEETEKEEAEKNNVAPLAFPRPSCVPNSKRDETNKHGKEDEFEFARRKDRRIRTAADKLKREIEKEIRYVESCVKYASLPKTLSLACTSTVARLIHYAQRRRCLALEERETFEHPHLRLWSRNLLESMSTNPDIQDQRRAAKVAWFRLVVDPTTVADPSVARHETTFRRWMEACDVDAEKVCDYVDGLNEVSLRRRPTTEEEEDDEEEEEEQREREETEKGATNEDQVTGLFRCLLIWHVFSSMRVSGGGPRHINRSDLDGLPVGDGLCFLYDDRRFLVKRGGRTMNFVYGRAVEACVAWIYHGPISMNSSSVSRVLFHTGLDDDRHDVGEEDRQTGRHLRDYDVTHPVVDSHYDGET